MIIIGVTGLHLIRLIVGTVTILIINDSNNIDNIISIL